METLTNVTISKVYAGKNGEGQYGKWWAYNFYLQNNVKKFSYFRKETGVIPREDMTIQVLEYEVKQDGEYTNYNVKKLTLPTQTQQKDVQTKKEVDWDAIAFKKCKFGFLQQAFVPWLKGELGEKDKQLLEEAAEQFANMCMRVVSDSPTASQTQKESKDTVGYASESEGAKDDTGAPTEDYEEYPK